MDSHSQGGRLSRRVFLVASGGLAVAATPIPRAVAQIGPPQPSAQRLVMVAALSEALAASPPSIVDGSLQQETTNRLLLAYGKGPDGYRAWANDMLDALDKGHAAGSFALLPVDQRRARIAGQLDVTEPVSLGGEGTGRLVAELLALVTAPYFEPEHHWSMATVAY